MPVQFVYIPLAGFAKVMKKYSNSLSSHQPVLITQMVGQLY